MDMSDDDLRKALNDSKDELFRLKFQLATGQLDNPMRIKDVKRDIARVQTIVRQRELGISHA
ncbi:MAG: 50S ribosomal protein L29 [Desulfocucumaceae bacterium]